MTSKTATAARPLSWTSAKHIATAFRTSDKDLAARVRALIPVCDKSAATIVDQVWDAYEARGEILGWAFGESTIQTSLNVAKAYVSIAKSLRDQLTTAQETSILADLVRIRRTRETIPVAGRKTGMAGGAKALNATIAACVTSPPAKWLVGVNVVAKTVGDAEAADRRGRTAAKRMTGDDDAASDVQAKHNETAADVRTGDEGATKNNLKAHRKSKNERESTVVAKRDPLEPATDGNSPAVMPGANVDNLRDASVDALIKELHKRITLGYVPTGKQDSAMTDLATAWDERVGEAPVSMAGKYLELTHTVRESAPFVADAPSPLPAPDAAIKAVEAHAQANDTARKARVAA